MLEIKLDNNDLVSKIEVLDGAQLPYREIDKIVNLIPERDTGNGLEEDDSVAVVISDLYFDELHLFFDMTDGGEFYGYYLDQHMLPEDWVEILATWRSFYEATDFDAVYQTQMARKAGVEKRYPKHVEWFSGLLKTVWEKKDYGWKMLEGLEEWVNRYKNDYEWMNLI